jgi:hypothetical protein
MLWERQRQYWMFVDPFNGPGPRWVREVTGCARPQLGRADGSKTAPFTPLARLLWGTP